MTYKLYVDDLRSPPDDTWVVCRTSEEAKQTIRDDGMPSFMSLDHDLGGEDTIMLFLHWLADEFYDLGAPPDYQVHSANPIGQQNIVSFLESWKRSLSI